MTAILALRAILADQSTQTLAGIDRKLLFFGSKGAHAIVADLWHTRCFRGDEPTRTIQRNLIMRNQLALTHNPIRSLFDSFFTDHLPEVFPDHFAPATDIAETENDFELTFEMPGLDENAIQLDVHERELTVTAERKAEPKVEGKTWHRVEQRTGKWKRTILLPDSADTGSVEASYRQGILRVELKKHPKSRPVRVQIKGA